MAGQDLIEHGKQTAVVHVRVGDEDTALNILEGRNQAAEDLFHFIAVYCITAIDKQILIVTANDKGITAAGGFDDGDGSVVVVCW